MIPKHPRRKRLLMALGLVLMACLIAERTTVLTRAAPTDFDDAYMYARYANNLLSGYGLAWNPGEAPVYGVTSLLHAAVVTALRGGLPRLSVAATLRLASGAAAMALLLALVGIAASWSRHPRLSRNWLLWTAVIGPLIAYHEAFEFHAGTGMDTMLSALANTAVACATLRLYRQASVPNIVTAAVASALAVLARPDNALCAVACPFLAVVVHAPRRNVKLLVVVCAASTLPLALLALAAWRVLGSPLPLSFFAKQPGYYAGFAGEFGWNPFLFLRVFFYSALPFALAVALFTDRGGARRAAVLLIPALASILALFRFNQIMGHLGRFYYPFLPYFVAAGALEFDAWLRRNHARRPDRAVRITKRVVIAVAFVAAGSMSLSLAAERYDARAQEQPLVSVSELQPQATSPLPELDSWQSAGAIAAILAAAPSGTTCAMSEHGLPGAMAPNATIIDVLGLHDPQFARHGFSAAELFRRKPDLIWLPHEDHTQMLRDIIDSNELWDHYVLYPEAFYFGLALRRDSPRFPQLSRLIAAEWRKAYPGVAMGDHVAVRVTRP